MKRAAVLIGVDRVADLPVLNDAVRGARRMRDWALAQGFEPQHVALLTDDQGPVKAAAVQEAVGVLLDPMAGIEQLLIYFAGHGLNINYGEFWLLSSALHWSTEAVDVARSAVLARYCSVPHVVFISDACRTAAVGVQQQFITGAPIFPAVAAGGAEQAVDQFFACTLGNPALEVQAQDAANAGDFVALYTEALLDILNGAEPTIIEFANDDDQPDGVIRPWPLKRVLRAKVSSLLVERKLHTRAVQTPDARITSDPGQAWIARLAAPEPAPVTRGSFAMIGGGMARDFRTGLGPTPERVPHSLPEWVDARLDQLLDRGRRPGDPPDAAQAQTITGQSERQSVEFEPRHFETRCGVKLRGDKVVRAMATGMRLEWVDEGVVLRAHPGPGPEWARALLVFADGSGAVVPLLPEFIAELSFARGEWLGLAYEASENSVFCDPDPARRVQRRYLREFVNAAVERGVFQPDRNSLEALAVRLLDAPLPDPVLLLHLAYALDDAGMVGRLRELVAELRARGAAPLFDVALLVHRPGDAPDDLLLAPPGMPLLARGWADMAARGVSLPGGWAAVSSMRQNGLWTRFTPAGVGLLTQQLFATEASHA